MADGARAEDGWVQVGWMPGPRLAGELMISPLDDEYLCSVEIATNEGGLRPEYVGRVVPIYARQEDIDNAQ